MFDWLKDFLSGIFGDFWGSLATWAIKILMGPFVFFVFGPMFRLSGYITEKILDQIKPHLDDVGLTLEGVAAWFAEVLRLQECISMYLTFMILALSVSLFKRLAG
jgi:hypothetical protein